MAWAGIRQDFSGQDLDRDGVWTRRRGARIFSAKPTVVNLSFGYKCLGTLKVRLYNDRRYGDNVYL